MTKSEKDKFIKLIKKGDFELKDLSLELKNDKDIIRESIIKNWRSFEFVDEILKNDVSFVKECLEINGQIFEFVSDEIKGKRDLCLFAISKSGEQYRFVKNQDKNDKAFIIEAVSLSGFSLKYMDECYKDNLEIAKIAVNESGFSFEYVSEKLRNNKELLIDAVKQSKSGYCFQHASLELKSDKLFVIELLGYIDNNQCNWLLKCSADSIKSDKEIAIEFVKKNGSALEFVSQELKNSKEVVYEAVSQYSAALQYSSELILDNLEFLENLLATFDVGYSILDCGSKRVKKNRDIIFKIIQKDGNLFPYLEKEFKSDEELICAAIVSVGNASRIANHIIPKGNDFLDYIKKIESSLGSTDYYNSKLLTTKERVLTILSVYYDSSKEGLWHSIPEIFKNDQDLKFKRNVT
jgi:hypothetical protein